MAANECEQNHFPLPPKCTKIGGFGLWALKRLSTSCQVASHCTMSSTRESGTCFEHTYHNMQQEVMSSTCPSTYAAKIRCQALAGTPQTSGAQWAAPASRVGSPASQECRHHQPGDPRSSAVVLGAAQPNWVQGSLPPPPAGILQAKGWVFECLRLCELAALHASSS